MTTALATLPNIYELIEEYNAQREALPGAIARIVEAHAALEKASHLRGEWGGSAYYSSRDSFPKHDLKLFEARLLRSAWRHVAALLHVHKIAPKAVADDLAKIFENPPPFEETPIRSVFKDFINDGDRVKIALAGFAEVFCKLDNFYKSHDNFKVGAKGLPKRIIITGCGAWTISSGWEWAADTVNALAAYRGHSGKIINAHELERAVSHPGVTPRNQSSFVKLNNEEELEIVTLDPESGDATFAPLKGAEGLKFRLFQNGNLHVFFDAEALRQINEALAAYYGDLLPDAPEDKPTTKKASTEVSKDLQFYRTPEDAARRLIRDAEIREGYKILEPSCGDGALLDAITAYCRAENIRGVALAAIEVDAGRAEQCRAKGYKVACRNFLQLEGVGDFDCVIMNPPFYGKHYVKHVEHALNFLKSGGKLHAILPASAKYTHKLLDKFNPQWLDLPLGSFKESGTMINTVIVSIRKP